MSQTKRMNSLMMALSAVGPRLFRQNTGLGWAGNKIVRYPNGDVLIKKARPLRAGLCVGSSDLIGWTPVTVTPEMVGRTIAVFTAVEDKAEDGRETQEQERFRSAVTRSGGLAIVARDTHSAVLAVTGWKEKPRPN